MSPIANRPRANKDTEARRLRNGIRALVRRFAISERADVACCGMTVAQAATLETLAAEGPMRLSDLGARLGIAPSTLTRNLVRLEGRMLVKRAAVAGDGRAIQVALTAAGERAAAAVCRQDEEFAASVLSRLPAGTRGAALDALDDILIAVRGATETCCPGAFDHLMTGIPSAGTVGKRRLP
jgi:DNA-binding MarR family transcriptional regulator